MARPAPAIDRAVAVLTYLSKHPTKSFTLTELSRDLDINKATCHAMLNALVEHGFLSRDADRKAYRLGPAILEIADGMLSEQARVLEFALPVLEALRDEVGVVAYASRLDRTDSVVLARMEPGRSIVYPPGREPRCAWCPPMGPVFAAFADLPVREAWLAQLRNDPTGSRREYYAGVLDATRRRGFDLVPADDYRGRLTALLLELSGGVDVAQIHGMIEDLGKQGLAEERALTVDADHGSARVFAMSAPVFGASGDVVLQLSLLPGPDLLTPEAIHDFGERLLRDTEAVTRSIAGNAPRRERV
jgi:DNA-binding IclR family transcriptional regulator